MGFVGRFLGKRVAERKIKEFEQQYWSWATQYFRIKVDGGMAPADALLEAHFTAYTRTWNLVEPVLARRGQAPHAYDSTAGMDAFAALAVWSQVDPDDVSAALDKQERCGGISWESIRAREFRPNE